MEAIAICSLLKVFKKLISRGVLYSYSTEYLDKGSFDVQMKLYPPEQSWVSLGGVVIGIDSVLW